MSIVLSDLNKLGYRKVRTNLSKDKLGFLKTLADTWDYDIYEESNNLWLRKKGRSKNITKKTAIEIKEVITKNKIELEGTYDFLENYYDSDYFKNYFKDNSSVQQVERNTGISLKVEINEIRQLFENSLAYDTPRKYSEFRRILLLILFNYPGYLKKFLKEKLLPHFFHEFPEGKFIILRYYNFLDKWMSFIRVAYSMDHFSLAELRGTNKGMEALRKWSSFYVDDMVVLFLNFFSILFYPKISVLPSTLFGMNFAFLFPENVEQKWKYRPGDWLQYIRSTTTFGREQISVFSEIQENPRLLETRYIHRFEFDKTPITELLKWYINKINDYLLHTLDACNFINEDGTISFCKAFEYNLTFDRLIRLTINSYATETPNVSKQGTFEIADLYESIEHTVGNNTNTADFFKKLFNPVEGKNLVKNCISSMPKPFSDYFKEINEEIYEELLNKVIDSIWIKNKITKEGKIKIRNKNLDREVEETKEEYVANFIRAIRNTTHGYFSEEDQQKRPSRYLVLSNANIPDSISYFPFLWLLAFLNDPSGFLGWEQLKWNEYIDLHN